MISRSSMQCTLVTLALAAGTFTAAGQAKTASARLSPARLVELRVDDLNAPLGIDDPAPRFSWQLSDAARGATQAAYEVEVFSSAALAAANKPDWSSGRVASDRSLNVRYAGGNSPGQPTRPATQVENGILRPQIHERQGGCDDR